MSINKRVWHGSHAGTSGSFENTLVFPKDAIEILGVKTWNEVVADYKQKMRKARINGERYRKYSDEELLEILKILWREFDGKVTQSKIIKRSQYKPTPSWYVLKRLGDPETWGDLVSGKKKPTQKSKKTIKTEATVRPDKVLDIKIYVPDNLKPPVVIKLTLEPESNQELQD